MPRFGAKVRTGFWVIDVASGKGSWSGVAAGRNVNAREDFAFSRDGARIASVSEDRTVRVWDVAGREDVLTLRGHSDEVRAVAFDPQGRWIASASADETAIIWDAQTGQRLHTLPDHAGRVQAAAFDPGGTRLVTGGTDGLIKVWEPGTGTPLATFAGHFGYVTCLQWSPDGQRIAYVWRMRHVNPQAGQETESSLAVVDLDGNHAGTLLTETALPREGVSNTQWLIRLHSPDWR